MTTTYPIGFVLSFPSLYQGRINSLPSLFKEILTGLFNIEPKIYKNKINQSKN